MDSEHRIGLLGLGVMTVAVAAPHLDALPPLIRDLGVQSRPAALSPVQDRGQYREMMLDREFTVRPGGTLRVDVPDADVEIRSGSDDKTIVRVFVAARDMEWGRDVFNRMEFDAGIAGDEVHIDARDPRLRRSDWSDRRGGVAVVVEVTAPRTFNAYVATGDGDIDIGDFEGNVKLETSDGDIYAGHLRGAEVTLETSDGEVSVESLAGERLMIHTQDGDVQVGLLTGPARVSTGDGNIRVYLEEGNDINLRTGDGDIAIYADPALRAEVDLSGESVRVASGFNLDGRVTRHGAQGQLNGGGPMLYAHTGDGTVVIRERTRDR